LSPGGEALARALEFQRQSIELTAEHVLAIDDGWVFRSPSLSQVWSHNMLWLTGPIAHPAAIELCQRHLGEALFWQLYLEDEATAQRLLQPLRADGWEFDVEVHLELIRPPDPVPDPPLIIEPGEDESLELMALWMRTDETLHLSGAEGVRQTIVKDRALWRARNARRFGIRGPDGAVAAITQLFSDGRVGQVEHVYTIPQARGRGYARALVSHAAAEAWKAEHELSFIVADDNNWPKQLYRRIGFEPLGRTWLLHLPAARVAERS
jgi:GNAT superfamily N-acetyltransferase